jgi:hypothetical protein
MFEIDIIWGSVFAFHVHITRHEAVLLSERAVHW